jgi:hypothetical protein
MTSEAILAQLKGLELQLTVLEARLRNTGSPATLTSFADLEGMLAGGAESTESEIEAAEYRVSWDQDGGAQG